MDVCLKDTNFLQIEAEPIMKKYLSNKNKISTTRASIRVELDVFVGFICIITAQIIAVNHNFWGGRYAYIAWL